MQNIPKIVSGGQTGADRAALDWALFHKLPCGGWCPKGRKAEDLERLTSLQSLNLGHCEQLSGDLSPLAGIASCQSWPVTSGGISD
jgi:hypothetical protein